MSTKKVLIIEPRSYIRNQLIRETQSYVDIIIEGMAKDLVRGYELCREKSPNIVILDGRLLLNDHISFTSKLMTIRPMQLIVIAEADIYDQLLEISESILEFHNLILMEEKDVVKACLDVVGGILRYDQMSKDIHNKHRLKIEEKYAGIGDTVIAIGASTGGVSALEMVLTDLKGDIPPILMVQHMSKEFTGKMANRLCSLSKIMVKEAVHGEVVSKNVAYLAPGDQHMVVEKYKGRYRIILDYGPLEHYQRPAVDRLFESVASIIGKKSIGVLLTGMGRDGAKGLKLMRDTGAYTIAQSESSCVVFGMPKAAIEIEAVCEVTPIDQIARKLMELSSSKTRANLTEKVV